MLAPSDKQEEVSMDHLLHPFIPGTPENTALTASLQSGRLWLTYGWLRLRPLLNTLIG